jgi:hypothetical protein
VPNILSELEGYKNQNENNINTAKNFEKSSNFEISNTNTQNN